MTTASITACIGGPLLSAARRARIDWLACVASLSGAYDFALPLFGDYLRRRAIVTQVSRRVTTRGEAGR